MPDPDLIAVALDITDGTRIDWDALAADMSPADQRVLQRFQQLQALADVHATTSPYSSTPGLESIRSTLPNDVAGAPIRWGSLEIVDKVGSGSYGDVYRARDPRLGRTVALKLLRRGGLDADDETSVIAEGHLLSRVRHPNVVTVFGAERIDGRIGVWMEFVEGETLEDELGRRGPLPVDEVARIGIELSSALQTVHEAGLLHRDLKAQNVMRDRTGRLVLMDFGAGHDATEMAGAGTLAGTPAYLAPEVLDGSSASTGSDIYALGVLLFHLLTSAFPVDARTLSEVRAAHQAARTRTVTNLRGDVPRALSTVIDRAIGVAPASRFRDAAEMRTALERAAKSLVPGRRRRTLLAVAGVVVSIATAAAVVIKYVDRPDDQVQLRTVWSGRGDAHPEVGAPSADGRYLPFWDGDGMGVVDLRTSFVRSLSGPITSRSQDILASELAISADGAFIACAWLTNEQTTYELRATATRPGEEPRSWTIFRHNDWLIEPLAWSPDGSWIAANLSDGETRQLVRISTRDGTLHRMNPVDPRGVSRVSVAPDGLHLAYDVPATQNTAQHDVFVVPVNGGPSQIVAGGQSSETLVGWSPDGELLVYVDGGSGTTSLRARRIVAGTAQGEPLPLRGDAPGEPLGITATGQLFFYAETTEMAIQIAEIDLASGARVGPLTTPATSPGPRSRQPQWSRDGQLLSYLSSPPRGGQRVLSIQPKTGDARILPLPLSMLYTYDWSPDRRWLAARAADFQGREGIYRIDTQTGEVIPVVLRTPSLRYFFSQWSDDGRRLYYLRGDGKGGHFVARSLVDETERTVVGHSEIKAAGPEPFPNMRDWKMSPDGKSIAGLTLSSVQADIWIVSVEQRTARKVLSVPHPPDANWVTANAMLWTPDSRAVLINRPAANSPLQREIWRVPADGTASHRLELGVTNLLDQAFAVHPDGRHIAFVTGGTDSFEVRALENVLPGKARR